MKSKGFNTPKMFYIKKGDHGRINDCCEWCETIGHPIYNIRTYNFNENHETLETTHFVDVPSFDIKDLLNKVVGQSTCMVDAEIPDNGRWAGNIVVFRNPMRRPISADIEYCQKEIRAMVRDADSQVSFDYTEIVGLINPFRMLMQKAATFEKPETVILEWTYFSEPAGILNENLVWWEYRSYVGA